jgi:long-subunit fatty acid transport protein
MQSAKPITNCKRAVYAFSVLLISSLAIRAQENSPYSRFGLGDQLSGQNILSRAMGGLSIPYSDYQSVNFINPASYAQLKVTTLDVGVDISSRTLRTTEPVQKYTSRYMTPSYLQLGVPLSKKGNWGMNFGMRPLTRINYNLRSSGRLSGIDSVAYNYIGNGGSYQAFVGTGIGTKNFSVGVNGGYRFGNKLYNTRVLILNDTVPYRKTNSADTTRFGGLFLEAGLLWRINLGKKTWLRVGANGSLSNKLNAVRDVSRETFEYSATNGVDVLDSVFKATEQKGTIIYPASYGFGLMLEVEDKWGVGAELSRTSWSQYRYYEKPDNLRDNWTFRFGAQLLPNITGKSYWSKVAYRVGFSYGPDPIAVTELNQYLLSAGVTLPVRRNFYTNQFTSINFAMEAGARGNKNLPMRESLFRLSMGLNLSDLWFNPRKYD